MPAAISNRHGIAFFSVPKSASTSMKMVLFDLEYGQPWSGDADKVHPTFPTYPVSSEDFSSTEGYWRFTVIRDPISRLLSSYGNRVFYHKDIRKSINGNINRMLFPVRNPGLRLFPSADNFFCNLNKYQKISYSIWHHTTSISNFIGKDLSRFDRIYRVQDISLLERDLSIRTGVKIKLPREQTAGPKVNFDTLTPEAKDKVLEYTQADYELLSDFFQPKI